MTLEQYTTRMQAKLKEFEEHWRASNANNAEDWPMEFDSESDWQEQLDAWIWKD
jgi:hypothetical protein